MTGKLYALDKKDVFVDSIIDAFLHGHRSKNLGTEPARWIFQGLQDLENDPVLASMLTDPRRSIDDPEIRKRCYEVITPEKIEEYFRFDEPANI